MKKRILSLLLTVVTVAGVFTGCGSKGAANEDYLTPDDFEPSYYTSELEIPEDAYYIVRTEKNDKGEDVTKYFPLLQTEQTFTEERDRYAGFDHSRVIWVNYNQNEGLIPTMYAGDKLIYKSSTLIPTTYALEKFFDNGYTVGVQGLEQDLSGNYKYTSTGKSGKGHVMTTSDATGFESLNADSIYFVAIGEDRVSPVNVSLSGTISGLNLMDSYDCDIRTGTEKLAATLTCNVHYFSSAETYMFGAFTFITDVIAELNVPDYVTTGYYNIGANNFFRYIADENINDYHSLSEEDYNSTIYLYDEYDNVVATSLGLVFDPDTGFLVENTKTDESNIPVEAHSYDEISTKEESDVTNKTALIPSTSGTYSGTYVIDSLDKEEISNNKYEYDYTATLVPQKGQSKETINLRFMVSQKDKTNIFVGEEHMITFKASNDFDGYDIITVTPLKNHDETISTEEEVVEESTENVETTEEIEEE